MIATSTTERFPFKAPWRENDPAAPTFYFRAGSSIERGQMEAELTSEHRAAKVWEFELRAACRTGIETLLAGDVGVDHLLELIDAEGSGENVELSIADQQMLAGARAVLAQYWEPYRELIAQQARRQEIAPIVALRRFCVDIVGNGVSFARGIDGLVAEATLSQLDELELKMAGSRAYSLQFPSTGARNFPPLSPSADDQPSSNLAPLRAGGSSGRKSGRKTPGSRSPRGSSK